MKQPIITICTSANFYAQAIDVDQQLEAMGYTVILPHSAQLLKEDSSFDPVANRTWLTNPNDYHRKTELMRGHFQQVEKADAVLVLNYEKHGMQGYIGGNVLMEMAVGFYLGKPILVLNDLPTETTYTEELIALEPIILGGELGAIQKTVPLEA